MGDFMELYEEIILKRAQNLFGEMGLSVEKIIETECYRALVKIKNVLEDPSLEDEACFMRIEEIIHIFEETGAGCEYRHDFG